MTFAQFIERERKREHLFAQIAPTKTAIAAAVENNEISSENRKHHHQSYLLCHYLPTKLAVKK